MGNRQDTRVILGSLRYKSAPDTTLLFNVPLIQTAKENIEFDRNIDVNLEQVFDDERQKSDIIRPTCKFSLLFQNAYSGFTNYPPFENNLYYLNSSTAAAAACGLGNPDTISWTGLPQYNEFDFIRTDYNVSGYTQPPNEHLNFITQSASSYNWNFFVSYGYENDYMKQMTATDKKTGLIMNWVAGDGIPFIIENTVYNGRNTVSFRCPVKHGMSVGEYVKLSFSYNGTDLFQIDSLGVGTFGSDEYVFNIIDVGYLGTTFSNGTMGTSKRVILNTQEQDTISTYYVRRNKILTESENAVLVKAGFEQNIFGEKKKYESSGFTPDHVARVSIKEGSQSYTLSFNKDVRVNPIRDNQKRPITELFFTVIYKGYFGWMFGIPNGGGGYHGLKQGWDFNLPLNSSGLPNSWWSNANSTSETGFPIGSYTTPVSSGYGPAGGQITFTYIESLKEGDVIDGDCCEWNDYDQKERVVSNIYHKLRFNPFSFRIGPSPVNQFGYYYQPHHVLTTRVYSDYIEDGDFKNVVGIPDYAHFSTTKNLFIWRDLYPYGFVDSAGLGVQYPFLNGVHYPYKNIIFRIIPEGTNYKEQTIIAEPITDNCE
jgi:hypothetical protein